MHQLLIKTEKTSKPSSLQNKRHKYWNIWDLKTTLVQLSTSDVRCTAQEYSRAARDVSMSSCTADWVYNNNNNNNNRISIAPYGRNFSYAWMPFKFHNLFHNMLTHLCDNTATELCSAQRAVVPTNLQTAELSRNWRQTNGCTLCTALQSSGWLSSELRAAVDAAADDVVH